MVTFQLLVRFGSSSKKIISIRWWTLLDCSFRVAHLFDRCELKTIWASDFHITASERRIAFNYPYEKVQISVGELKVSSMPFSHQFYLLFFFQLYEKQWFVNSVTSKIYGKWFRWSVTLICNSQIWPLTKPV